MFFKISNENINYKINSRLSHDYLSKIDSPEFYKFISKYKFVISYENSVCNDYITEKLWRPLIIVTVPIYFGSPTIQVRYKNFAQKQNFN